MQRLFFLLILVASLLVIGMELRHREQVAYERSLNLKTQPDGTTAMETSSAPLLHDPDSYFWLAYAGSQGRVRHTHLDNAPYGREVHWSSAYLWYVRGMTTLQEWCGVGVDAARLGAAKWNNPLLLVVLVLFLAAVCRRYLHVWSFAALAAGVVMLPALKRDFSFARVDYHGLQHLLLAGMLVALALSGAGYVRSSSADAYRSARKWVVGSGVLGGLCVWLQATLAYPVILSVLGAFILFTLLFVVREEGATAGGDGSYALRPDLWRLWGAAGAASSLFFYLLEYAPNHFGMRLEVNHPLLALSWLAGGECARQVALAEAAGSWRKDSRGWIVLACAVVCAIYPLAVLFGPVDWFVLKHPFMVRIHQTIDEFRPLMEVFSRTGWAGVPLIFGVLPLLIPVAVYLAFSSRTSKPEKLLLLLALAPALVAGRMVFSYVRFSGLWSVMLLALFFVALLILARRAVADADARRLQVVLCAVFVVSCIPSFLIAQRLADHQQAGPDAIPGYRAYLYFRDLVQEIDRQLPPDEDMFMSDANITPFLHHFGSRRGTAGLYWENLDGLKATALVLTDYGELEAREIVEERGLHYLLFDASPDNLARLHYARYGQASEEGVRLTFGYRITRGLLQPEWLEPVDADAIPLLAAGTYRLFRVKTGDQGESPVMR